jgi:hypothetical protein
MKMGFFAAMIAMAAAPAALSQPMTPMSTVTLNVPLQIGDHPDSVAQLWCELRVSITGGSFTGTKKLTLRVPRAASPQVRGWRCILAANDGYRQDPRSLDLASYQALVPLVELRGRF